MTSKDRVLSLCETHGIAISQLEKRLGYANNYFKRLKKEIPYDRAVAVAEFFGTSVDYILTGEMRFIPHFQRNILRKTWRFSHELVTR